MDSFFTSFADFTNVAAKGLARAALTDVELREALETVPDNDGVRIGKYQITYRVIDNERIYDISGENTRIEGIAFYETARAIVKKLNHGNTVFSPSIHQLIKINDDYIRTADRSMHHHELIEHYHEIGDDFRADLNACKRSRDLGRLEFLQFRLLNTSRNY